MASKRFDEQMQAFGQWKADLLAGIQRYQKWLDANHMGDSEDDLRIYEVLDALRKDSLTIAFLAEFARGKTELINAIFFSEYDRRLLPSEAGRTTMCPTELFHDSDGGAFIRLLPIETRLKETSLAEYKMEPIHWTNIPLELDDPESMAEAFQEIVRTKRVPRDEAMALGLYDESDHHLHSEEQTPAELDIPMWRHALISFPHPLLKQGLTILDTPGLNALGSEPELTLNMLPNAQAVVFVLAADTGVTRSDLEMWRQNVKPLRAGRKKGLLVVLNKVDTLWDELKNPQEVDRIVEEQRVDAGRTLGIEPGHIVPVSAQKGLLAKIRHNEELLQRSNIPALENILATEILPQKQALVREHVLSGVGSMVKETHDLLATRRTATKKQLDELRGLSGKNNEVIQHLMQKTREEQVAYYKNVESFQANKKLLAEQSRKLLEMLDLQGLDKLISETRKSMSDSWTTHGLKTGMKTFFDGLASRMDETSAYIDQLNRLVITVYRQFHQDHGLSEIRPVIYSVTPYKLELQKLYQEAEAFRTSTYTTMTEQHFVIKKFFISLVSHARNVFYKAHADAEKWSRAVMSPLVKQIKEHKAHMEQRLDNLRKIHQSRDTLQSRVEELEKMAAIIERQYSEVDAILNIINRPLTPPETTERTATG